MTPNEEWIRRFKHRLLKSDYSDIAVIEIVEAARNEPSFIYMKFINDPEGAAEDEINYAV